MRTFFRAHWKVIVAILLLIGLAVVTVNTSSAGPDPSLAARLRMHVVAVASAERNTATSKSPEDAAVYIENVLGSEGYRIRRQAYRAGGQTVRNIEVSVANVAPGARPARIFIVGTRYDSAPGAPGANDEGSGTAAVLELARLLKDMRPSQGTEVKFVFFVNEEPPWLGGQPRGAEMGRLRDARQPHAAKDEAEVEIEDALILETIGYYTQARHGRPLPAGFEGRRPDASRSDAGRLETGNFIAFVGTLASSRLVQDALSAFQAASGFPARGLAAPAYVRGVTLSDHGAYQRFGYPAIMITDTAFMRYPYYHTAEDTPDNLDYESVARVVAGLARTITALAAGAKA